ncbi:MAG: hypothetical protein ACK531_04350 [Cyanobacteriota bacterium]
MRITDLRIESGPDSRRAAATVIWETRQRPAETLFFEAQGPLAEELQASPEAFALACLPLAAWAGEQRLRIEAPLCPRLTQGLRHGLAIWASVHGTVPHLELEAAGGWRPPARATPERTASFLSGGVDALSTLRRNRLDYPLEHPGSIRDCLFLYGTNGDQMGPCGPHPQRFAFYKAHQQLLQALGEQERFTLLALTTNVRSLCPSYACWTRIGFGPATLAAAHLLTNRLTRVLFASDGHGLLEGHEALEVPLYSSAALEVMLDQPGVQRQQKLALLSEWPAGLDLIQPCHLLTIPEAGRLNCGRCEKCLRTKINLACLGLPISGRTFTDASLQPGALLRMPLVSRAKVRLFQPLVPELWRRGYRRLAVTLATRLWLARLRLAVRPPAW